MQRPLPNIEEVPIERVLPDPDNARKHVTAQEQAELVDSIVAHGIQVPLIVFRESDAYRTCDGHLRLAAAGLASLKTVPVLILPHKPMPADMLLAQLVINDQRCEPNPIDRLESYVRLMELKKWSPAELAKALSVKAAKVSAVLALGKLTAEEQELVRTARLLKHQAMHWPACRQASGRRSSPRRSVAN